MQSITSTPRRNMRREGFAFDIAASRPLHMSKVAYRQALIRRDAKLLKRKSLDGVRQEKTLLQELQKCSLWDTFKRAWRKTELYSRRVKRVLISLLPDIAPRKMLYGSLVGGVAFGMVSMAFMEHSSGPGVFARSEGNEVAVTDVRQLPLEQAKEEELVVTEYNQNDDAFFQYFSEAASAQYEENIREMVKGYPIEEMLPYILEKDRTVAAFLIGISKKESNWGKRIPVLDGQDCFNYWGYRGVRRMMGTGGHTCFNSRKDAVDTVAKRIENLVYSEKMNTPEKMIVWKCGFSCSGHSRESVRKWISDVDMYFGQLNDGNNE